MWNTMHIRRGDPPDRPYRTHWFGICILISLLCVPFAHAQDIPACDPAAPLANGDPSNSGRYTVYFECYSPDESVYTVFAYDTEIGETFELGETADDLTLSQIVTARWLTDTLVAFRSETGGGTYNWRSVYIADTSEAGSLREIARDYVSRPRYGENPPRYEWAVENGITETVTVYRYDVELDETTVLYVDACLLRDDLSNELSCHMVTPNTNEDFTDEAPTRLILNVGDSAREIKTVDVRALPSGELLYSVDSLGAGYGEWISADTVAVFNLAFDFETGGFSGLFIQFDDVGEVINEEAFVLPNGEEFTQHPMWLQDEETSE